MPSVPRSRISPCGGAASVGSRFSRASDFSSRIISSSSPWRCATVPMRASLLDDQRVAYCVQPRPSTRISICSRRYSSCCASGFARSLPFASGCCSAAATSSALCARCFSHCWKSSIACAYCSTALLSSTATRSSRRDSRSSACAASAFRPSACAPAAACRTYSTSDCCCCGDSPE